MCIRDSCDALPSLRGAMVNPLGQRGLSCKKNTGRVQRRAWLNDLIQRTVIRAEMQAVRERQVSVCMTERGLIVWHWYGSKGRVAPYGMWRLSIYWLHLMWYKSVIQSCFLSSRCWDTRSSALYDANFAQPIRRNIRLYNSVTAIQSFNAVCLTSSLTKSESPS